MVRHLPANAGDAGDTGSIPGSGGSPGGENGNPLQDSCLGNPMDRRALEATVRGVAKSDMTKHAHTQGQGRVGRRKGVLQAEKMGKDAESQS